MGGGESDLPDCGPPAGCSVEQCRQSGGVCPQIQCGAYEGVVEEMMCVVYVSVTKGA